MTRQFEVILALKALVAAALPAADVRGFDGDTTAPATIPDGGCVIGLPGDSGQPEVDLSPLSYNYGHQLMLEVAAPKGEGGAALDAMLIPIGTAIEADRTLGGLCEFLEAEAPDRNDRTIAAGTVINWATVAIVASYATSNPLA